MRDHQAFFVYGGYEKCADQKLNQLLFKYLVRSLAALGFIVLSGKRKVANIENTAEIEALKK